MNYTNNIPETIALFHFYFMIEMIPINYVIRIINTILECSQNINYYYHEESYIWKIKYTQNEIISELYISLLRYKNLPYVEVNRINGDSNVLFHIYKNLKNFILFTSDIINEYDYQLIINKIKNMYKINQFNNIKSSEDFSYKLEKSKNYNDKKFIEENYPYIRMTNAPNYEAIIESSKIWCDMFKDDFYYKNIYNENINNVFTDALSTLIMSNWDDVIEFTLVAIKYFIDLEYSDLNNLIKWNIIDFLLNSIKNELKPQENYKDIQMRRNCAYFLKKLTNPKYISRLVDVLNNNNFNIEDWKNNCSIVTDNILKNNINEIFSNINIY